MCCVNCLYQVQQQVAGHTRLLYSEKSEITGHISFSGNAFQLPYNNLIEMPLLLPG